jgi:hypothetical protein
MSGGRQLTDDSFILEVFIVFARTSQPTNQMVQRARQWFVHPSSASVGWLFREPQRL